MPDLLQALHDHLRLARGRPLYLFAPGAAAALLNIYIKRYGHEYNAHFFFDNLDDMRAEQVLNTLLRQLGTYNENAPQAKSSW
jgi:hypothetical protein